MNELDLQKLHLAPKPVQFLVALCLAALLLVAGYFVMFQEQWTNLKDAETKEETLKTEFEQKSRQAANLDNLEAELGMIKASIEELIKQLPTSNEIPSLVQELYQAGAKNGLTMNTVIPRPPVKEDANIERLPFTISVIGSYEQLAQFMRDVGRMSRIVTLSSITITAAESNNNAKDKKSKSNKLKLTAVASTYKAIDAPAASEASGAASAAQ